MSYLTIEDVRNLMLDRGPDDNEISIDLAFSDEEIANAIARTAREYNSIPPYGVDSVNADYLPMETNLFLYGAAQQLCLSRKAKLMRNDIDYSAGNVQVSPAKKEIQYLDALQKEFRDYFIMEAKQRKVTMNVMNGFGVIG
jgi:hypothetical protein